MSFNKKSTVDDYRTLSISRLKKWGYLSNSSLYGTVTWSRGGEVISSIGISTRLSEIAGTARLMYANTQLCTNEKTDLDYQVQLVTTSCYFGGIRWWFRCPLSGCGRRVGVLYLGKYAGCRHCYDLTYQSCQDSHKSDWLAYMMGMSPKQLNRQRRIERLLNKWNDF